MWCRLPCTLKSSRNLKSSHQTLAQWTALTLACFWMAPKSQRSSRWVTISLVSTDFNDVSLFIYVYTFTYHLQNMQNVNRLKIRGIMKIAFLFFYLVLSWATYHEENLTLRCCHCVFKSDNVIPVLMPWQKFEQSMLTVLSLSEPMTTEHYLESQPQRREMDLLIYLQI